MLRSGLRGISLLRLSGPASSAGSFGSASLRCASTSGLGWSTVPPPPPLPTSPPPPIDYQWLHGRLPGQWDSMWPPSNYLGWGLENLHSMSGLEWWAVIAMGSAIIRFSTFPVSVMAQRISAKLHNVKPEMERIEKQAEESMRSGDYMLRQECEYDRQDLFKKHGIRPGQQILLTFIQAAVFITFFWCLKMFARGPIEGFDKEGVAWFKDLSSPIKSDPLGELTGLRMLDGMIGPLINGITIFFVLHTATDGIDLRAGSPRAQFFMRAMKYVAPIGVTYASTWFPSGIVFYWVCSNILGLLTTLLIRTPLARRVFSIPARRVDDAMKADPKDSIRHLGIRKWSRQKFEGLKSGWPWNRNAQPRTPLSQRKADDASAASLQPAGKHLKPLHRLNLNAAASPLQSSSNAAAVPSPATSARRTAREIQAEMEKKRRSLQW